MEFYLFRHGFAPLLPGSDFDRMLDESGRKEVLASARLLAGIPFELLVCSPLVRAVQTAELIADEIGFRQSLQLWPEASPDGRLQLLLDRLQASGCERILLVSHQPLVSNLVEHLSGARIYMDTAAVLGLRMDLIGADCGEIIFRGLK